MESIIIAGAFTILGSIIGAGATLLTSFFENKRSKKQHILSVKEKLYEEIIQDYEEMITKMVEYSRCDDITELREYYRDVFIKKRMEKVGRETVYLNKEFNVLLNQALLEIRKGISIIQQNRNAFIDSRNAFDKVIDYIKNDIND